MSAGQVTYADGSGGQLLVSLLAVPPEHGDDRRLERGRNGADRVRSLR